MSRPTSRFRSADRVLFTFGGLVLGFTLAWLHLEKAPDQPARAPAGDPHAGLTGARPQARDLPGAGGGAPPISTVPKAGERIRELKKAVGKSPKDYRLLVELGNASYDAQDWRQAVDTFERAVKIRDTDAGVLTDLGVSYRSLGNIDKAIELFDRAIKADQKHWPALFNLAIVYGLDKGDVPKAKAILTKLKAEHPNVPALDRLEKRLEERGRTAR